MDKFVLKAINSKIPKKYKVQSIRQELFNGDLTMIELEIKKRKEKDLYIKKMYLSTKSDIIKEVISKMNDTRYEHLINRKRIVLKKRIKSK